jgi:predicted transcriptional regulator
MPVGHYTSFDVHPICGLATREKLIGQFDDPRYFLDPERVNAAILWFGQGFVEYKTPNYLLPSQQPEELEISFEIASEAPGANDQWPSDIRFYLNDVRPTLDDLKLEKHFWTIRFAVEEDAQHVGGLTLYGTGFGNYNQDIQFRMYYSQRR